MTLEDTQRVLSAIKTRGKNQVSATILPEANTARAKYSLV
jgi:hypothetical protein